MYWNIHAFFLQLYVYSFYIVLKILKKEDDKENQCKYFGFVLFSKDVLLLRLLLDNLLLSIYVY